MKKDFFDPNGTQRVSFPYHSPGLGVWIIFQNTTTFNNIQITSQFSLWSKSMTSPASWLSNYSWIGSLPILLSKTRFLASLTNILELYHLYCVLITFNYPFVLCSAENWTYNIAHEDKHTNSQQISSSFLSLFTLSAPPVYPLALVLFYIALFLFLSFIPPSLLPILHLRDSFSSLLIFWN